MAMEITAQASLTLQRSASLVLQASATATPTQAGTKGLSNYVSVSTSAAALSFTGLSTVAYLFLKNETTTQILLSMDSGGSQQVAALNQNDVCLIPVNRSAPANFYVRIASGASVNLFVAAVEQ